MTRAADASGERDPEPLAARVRRGHRRSLGRALSWIENRDPRADALLTELREHAARPSARIGVTGAPGVGKSSMVAALIGPLRARGARVAVLAVDPTSPLSGGALLADRVRMRGHDDDDGVFIRSLASRGGVGGLAHATDEAAELLAAAGFDIVVVETVGVGQLEMAIVGEADRVYLLVSPESGDLMQFLKGGVMEVVDRAILNKKDRPGADEALRVLEQLARESDDARPLAISCADETGIEELADVVFADAEQVRSTEFGVRQLGRVALRLQRRCERLWVAAGWRRAGGIDRAAELADDVVAGRRAFGDALDALLGIGDEDAADSNEW